MNLNFFINNLKHVEKLNKTNIKFIEYNNNFVKYLNSNNSVLELFKNLSHKSSCSVFIIENFLTNNEIINLLEKISEHILKENYNIDLVVNYVINIVSNKTIRYCFLESMNGKCLFKDTIFNKIFVSDFSKISKLNSQNDIIINSIFMKIFSTKKGINMFLNLIDLKVTYNYANSDAETNNFLLEKDIFYKCLITILIEIFNNKYSFYIKNINDDNYRFTIFKFIENLIRKNYIHIINELRFNVETLHDESIIDFRRVREKNIRKILNDYDYYNLVDNFYLMSIIWLNNLINSKKIKSDFIENNNELIDNLLHGIYYHYLYNFSFNNSNKYILNLIENILKKRITKNYNLIIDYIYLLKDFVCLKKEQYKYFNLYLGKLVINMFDIYSYIYDYVKDNQYEIFNFTLKVCSICQETIFKENNFRNILKQKLLKNKTNLKKFTLNVIEISNQCLENLDVYIFNNENNMNYFTLGNIYYDHFKILLSTIKNLCKYYPNILFSNELKDLFKNFIGNMIVKNDNICIHNIVVKYDEIEVNEILKDIIINISNYKTILYEINLKKLRSKLLYNGKISVSEIKYLNKIISDNMLTQINKKLIIHPSKFCDPITDSLIEHPIMLPNEVIVDKSMILRYLLNNRANPFDRQYLDNNLLEEYNKKLEVIEKINIFNKELQNYKNKNNLI